MKNVILALFAGCLLLAPLGCGSGIEAGPATDAPTTVDVPPATEKPNNYAGKLGGRRPS